MTTNPTNIKEFMDFLCWVNRCTFPKDLPIKLEELGLGFGGKVVLKMSINDRINRGECDILISLWQDYCLHCDLEDSSPDNIGHYIFKYIETFKGKI